MNPNAQGWKMYASAFVGLVVAANDFFLNGNHALGIKEAAVALGTIGLAHKLAKLISAIRTR